MEVIYQDFLALLPNQQKWIETTIFSIAKWKKREKWNFLKKNPPKYLADWNNLRNIALINTEQTFCFEFSKYEIMEKQIDKESISKRDIILNESFRLFLKKAMRPYLSLTWSKLPTFLVGICFITSRIKKIFSIMLLTGLYFNSWPMILLSFLRLQVQHH